MDGFGRLRLAFGCGGRNPRWGAGHISSAIRRKQSQGTIIGEVWEYVPIKAATASAAAIFRLAADECNQLSFSRSHFVICERRRCLHPCRYAFQPAAQLSPAHPPFPYELPFFARHFPGDNSPWKGQPGRSITAVAKRKQRHARRRVFPCQNLISACLSPAVYAARCPLLILR